MKKHTDTKTEWLTKNGIGFTKKGGGIVGDKSNEIVVVNPNSGMVKEIKRYKQ